MWTLPFKPTDGREKAPDPNRTYRTDIEIHQIHQHTHCRQVQRMIDESFEETNEIQSWTGGNTDFSDLDEDEPVSVQ